MHPFVLPLRLPCPSPSLFCVSPPPIFSHAHIQVYRPSRKHTNACDSRGIRRIDSVMAAIEELRGHDRQKEAFWLAVQVAVDVSFFSSCV